MIDIESKEFIDLLSNLKKERHERYNETVDYSKELAVHAYGDTPIDILNRKRPRESEDIRQYRVESYEPKTKSKFGEATKVMKKMFNKSLYSIVWPEPISVNINEKQTLKEYVEKDYKDGTSLLDWWKDQGLKYVLSNPNGYFIVMPGEFKSQNEYLRPYVKFFKEEYILFDEYDYVIFHTGGEISKNATYLIVDDNAMYWFHEERNSSNGSIEFVLDNEVLHEFGYLPCWKAGGLREGKIFKSFFDDALPYWNDAVCKGSDLDAIFINHAFPHMWAIEIDCTNDGCHNGRIEKLIERKGESVSEFVKCPACQGRGKQISKSPYDYFAVNQDVLGDNPAIVPPAGYISPDSSIIELYNKKVDSLMQEGMVALKMHVVVGDNQSGRAKEWDRKELNETIRDVSDLMFMTHVYNSIYFINRYRYKEFGTPEKLEEQLPVINAPQFFDILTVGDLTEEVKEASTAGINSNYIATLTKDVANKRFATNTQERDILNAIIDLDPFVGVSFEDKMLISTDGTVDKKDVIISNNIKRFVYKAIAEDENFLQLPIHERYEKMEQYAIEIESKQQNIKVDVTGQPGE